VTFLEVLVSELGSVDRLSTSSISCGKIASLDHELRNDTVTKISTIPFKNSPMEGRSLVMQRLSGLSSSFFTGAQSAEVLGSLWDDVVVQLERNTSSRLT
jgi:hypothetical protein